MAATVAAASEVPAVPASSVKRQQPDGVVHANQTQLPKKLVIHAKRRCALEADYFPASLYRCITAKHGNRSPAGREL